MKINLAKSAGLCFGVRRALDIAFATAKNKKNVYMLGDIVHNENVVNNIRDAGIKKILHLGRGKSKTLIIRAHGSAIDLIQKARNLNYDIVDATCPMVKEIHKIAVNCEKKGYRIIIIGDKKHDEVKGIMGQLKNKVLVIDAKENIPLTKIKRIKKAAIVMQSTQNVQKVLDITKVIKRYIPCLKVFNTVCRPTRLKQNEIKILPKKNEAMVIIGSRDSANTKRLFEISKAINKRSYWINSKKEINPGWFKGIKSVGITAGSSTPDYTINEIAGYLSSLRF
jgi:4-hydroxy-3-methylbut-2-enyl diphosphate reductase